MHRRKLRITRVGNHVVEVIQHIVNIFNYEFAYRSTSVLILEDPIKLWTHHIFLHEFLVIGLRPILEHRILNPELLGNLILADLFAFHVDITLSVP